MSSTEQSHPQSQVEPNGANSVPSIETVYTTVESQADRTDWLTVVSNLRQINRQLIEQIARLEAALASAKQEAHKYREENQNHEITILQQQDDLNIAQERVGELFQQLENSHQIGLRQQTLIESLSQQLDISQAIVPQLEAENEHLNQQYQQQAQQLIEAERVTVELERRLKVATAAVANSAEVNLSNQPQTVATEAIAFDEQRSEDPAMASPSPVERVGSHRRSALSELEILAWTPAAGAAKPILSPPLHSWRDAVASERVECPEDIAEREPQPPATDRAPESPKSSPNWPSPTLDLDRPPATTLAIELPKFPRKSQE